MFFISLKKVFTVCFVRYKLRCAILIANKYLKKRPIYLECKVYIYYYFLVFCQLQRNDGRVDFLRTLVTEKLLTPIF